MPDSDPIRLTAIPLAGRKAGAGGRVVVLFTREMGPVRVFARRSGKKSKSLSLSPFSTYQVLVLLRKEPDRSKSLAELREFQPERYRAALGEGRDLAAWATASALAELLAETIEIGDPHPYLFDILQSALDCLEEGAAHDDLLIAFIMKFLEHAGYKPRLHRGAVRKSRYRFDIALGGVSKGEEDQKDEELFQEPGTRIWLTGKELDTLEELRVARFTSLKETRLTGIEAERLVDLLSAYVEYHFEVRLKSFSIWREMRPKRN